MIHLIRYGIRHEGKSQTTCFYEGSQEATTSNQQLGIRAFSPKKESSSRKRFNSINFSTAANADAIAELMVDLAQTNARFIRMLEQIQQ